jgi:hypothetical protein
MVQLLALTLLETLIRNCGDNVHQHIQDREVLQEMVKIMKKKVDTRVRDKIIVLVDSWKETFGGHGAPYPQYYMAYSQLQSLGVQFPRHRDVHRVPTLIPPQSQSIASPYQSLSSGLQPSGMVTPRSEANIHIPTMRYGSFTLHQTKVHQLINRELDGLSYKRTEESASTYKLAWP